MQSEYLDVDGANHEENYMDVSGSHYAGMGHYLSVDPLAGDDTYLDLGREHGLLPCQNVMTDVSRPCSASA